MDNNPERKIVNVCQTCRLPIYEGEPIYTSSKGKSSGYTKGAYGGTGFFGNYQGGAYGGHQSSTYDSEIWAQCAWCYDQWQLEVAANKSFWIKWWLGGILFTIIATIISIAMFPGLEGSENKKVSWYRIKIFALGSWQIPLLAPLTLAASLFLVNIFGKLFQPAVNRYKLRKRTTKKL